MNQTRSFLLWGITITVLMISFVTATRSSQYQSSLTKEATKSESHREKRLPPSPTPPPITEQPSDNVPTGQGPSPTTKQPSTDNVPTGPASDALPGGTSYPLLEGQCELGKSIDSLSEYPSEFAGRNMLYIDVSSRATCSGIVSGWEICYQSSEDGSSSFELFLLSSIADGYQVRSAHVLLVEQLLLIESIEDVSCVYVKATKNVTVFQGEYVGFVCNDDIKTGFVQSENSNGEGSLLVFNFTSQSELDSIPSSKLYRPSHHLFPQFRILINESEQTQAPSTTKKPCSDGPTTIWTSVFTSVVIASAIVIFVLFLMVCLMGCYICQFKCKCCRAIMRCCRCCRKRKVHRITVEPIMNQSMQYNDGYDPQDPAHIITGGKRYRANIYGNPAYASSSSDQLLANNMVGAESLTSLPASPMGHDLKRALPSQDASSTATELSTVDQYDSPRPVCNRYRPESTVSESFAEPSLSSEMDLDVDNMLEDSREFDHTYEMIQSGKFVQIK